MKKEKLLFFVTEDWAFCSHRIPVAAAAKAAGYHVCVATRVRDHGDVIRQAGLELIPFEMDRGGLNPFAELVTLIRLIALYRKIRPDIVHNVAMKPVIYGSIAARVTHVPKVVNALIGMGWLFTSGSRFVRGLKILVRWALYHLLRSGIVIVQNPDDERLLLQLGVPRNHICRIAGSGVDLAEFKPRPEPEGPPLVILPARLLWDKGVGEFVAAARALKEQGLKARFALAGEPDPSNPASIPPEEVQAWVDEGMVEHLGWVKDMPALMAQSHIVCLPSYREGLPKALIEAAAAGRPIVTTDAPGCRETVRDGENGFVVPLYNEVALAAALAKLVEDPQLRQQMGAKGRAIAEAKFGLEVILRETLALYKTSVEGRSDAG